MSLEKYLGLWGLSSPHLIAQTRTSQVYKVKSPEGEAALKLLTPLGIGDEFAAPLALEFFGGNGAVKLLQHDRDAQLLEFVNGPSLLKYVNEGRGEEALAVLCQVATQLHSQAKPLPQGLIPLERRFRSLLEYRGAHKLLLDAKAVAKELLCSATDEKVLHGDLHHENVLLHPERGWIAIDPKGLLGERTFDAANMIYNPVNTPELVKAGIPRNLKLVAVHLQLDLSRFTKFAFAYGALSALWSEEDGASAELSLYVLRELRKLI